VLSSCRRSASAVPQAECGGFTQFVEQFRSSVNRSSQRTVTRTLATCSSFCSCCTWTVDHAGWVETPDSPSRGDDLPTTLSATISAVGMREASVQVRSRARPMPRSCRWHSGLLASLDLRSRLQQARALLGFLRWKYHFCRTRDTYEMGLPCPLSLRWTSEANFAGLA
jgi:hypothetical protein